MWLLMALSSPSHAFCGTYVGTSDSELLNGASKVVIAREGYRTTLTLANDYDGDLDAFALVVPVPAVLGEDDVRVINPAIIDAVDAYSTPRLVQYSCDDFHDHYYKPSRGCASQELYAMADADDGGMNGGVVVEAEFTAGEYQIVVLSAEESTGLFVWLNENGYSVAPAAQGLLQDYIDEGSYFFAAKVDLEGDTKDWLSPLQFSYDSPLFSLPIRLGTANSPGEQELLVYALTDQLDGRVGISNYDERTLEDNECMLPEGIAFEDWFADQLDVSLNTDEDAGWLFEYGWTPYHCDPCPNEPLGDQLVRDLGFSAGTYAACLSGLSWPR